MSASQEKTGNVPGRNVIATEDISQPDDSAPMDGTAAPRGDQAPLSPPMPTEQVATLKPAPDSPKATTEPRPDEGDQSHLGPGKLAGGTGETETSPYDAKFHALQERILQLEAQAMRPSRNFKSHKPRATKTTDRPEDDPIKDDKELRKFIRKAPYGRRWVESAEAQAEETAEERKEFGKTPNKSKFPTYPQKDTMYHVTKDGKMRQGDQFQVVLKEDTDYLMNYDYSLAGDTIHRQVDEPQPHRGVRPPLALRPIYKEPEIERITTAKHPLWRRLPPTEWETSDTDEWSTDTSTRSNDFDYYRARLRGDFEWELDRLNSQVRRYKMHQEKKKARLLADRAKEENDRMEKELEQGGSYQHTARFPHLKNMKPAGEYGLPSLNRVDWYRFRAARTMEPQMSFAIDVLDGEPKISDTLRAIELRGTTSAVDGKGVTLGDDDPSQTRKTESTQDANAKDNDEWNGRGPLPERIRINSKPIIDNLAKIHGKELYAQQETRASVVMLRPFKMLNNYAKDIRELSEKLPDAAFPNLQTTVPETATQQPGSADAVMAEPRDPSPEGNAKSGSSTQEPRIDLSEKVEVAEHFKCLHEFLNKYISKKIKYLNSVDCDKVVFSDLWHLFTPGTLVISSDGKQAYRVASLRSKRHKVSDPWGTYRDSVLKGDKGYNRRDITIKCIFVDFDGRNLGPVVKTFFVNKFDGDKDVTSLEIYPLQFHILKEINERSLKSPGDSAVGSREEELKKGLQELRDRLIKRGRLFVSTAGVKHMYYAGLTVAKREEVESQVIIDSEEAYSSESRKDWRPEINRLVGTVLDPDPSEPSRGCDGPCCWQENIHDDSYVEIDRNMDFMNNMMAEIKETPHKLPPVTIFPRPLKETESAVNALTDDELMVMSHSAPGFVLRDRSWAILDLDNLLEIKHFSDHNTETTDDDLDEEIHGAFGQLVLPEGHKKMVLSLISQHFRNKESTDNKDEQLDIVRGKGKGLIILLHGAPGVGKTTTAEGVAEVFKKPLFQITCGDLGSSPKEVEAALVTNFALANRWGCILLLDEADVFLAERRREDFNRNGMVAVFLRVLEYYAGILFLTTNRIGDFDEAFASRIHMSLHYPALDEVSTVKVFRLNLNLIKNRLKDRIRIEEDEIIAAACQHWREQKDARWNGRQIRNACQTALALAEFDAQPKGQKYNIKEKSSTKIYLKLNHLKVVSNAYLEFTEYLKAVHGAGADERAKESGLRALDTLIDAMSREKARNQDTGRRPSGQDDRSAVNRSPLHGFKLGSESHSYQHPGAPVPSSSVDPRQYDYHPAYYGVQPHAAQHPRDMHLAPGHSMQFAQGHHAGSQFLGDPQRTAVPPHLQGPPPGSHLQPPQAYPGGGGGGQAQAQYQVPSSQTQAQTQQPYPPQGTSYPSATETSTSTGPLTPVSPPYYGGGSQGGQSQRVSGGWTTPDQTGGEHGQGQGF